LAFGFGFGVSFGVGVSFVGSDFETVSCCFRAAGDDGDGASCAASANEEAVLTRPHFVAVRSPLSLQIASGRVPPVGVTVTTGDATGLQVCTLGETAPEAPRFALIEVVIGVESDSASSALVRV